MSPRPAPLVGSVRPPGDKSTTHRALLLAALADGTSAIRGALDAADTRSTLSVIRALGAQIEGVRADGALGEELRITGRPEPLSPDAPLDCGNAGTLARLLIGLLAPRRGSWKLVGDESLSKRPMGRVTEPLAGLGARVLGVPAQEPEGASSASLPLEVVGASLRGGRVEVALPSAQVKSALLLAALGADSPLTVVQHVATRDETERMLPRFGIAVERAPDAATVTPGALRAAYIEVPGDASAAAFPLVGALLVPGSRVRVEGVDLSPRRTGFLRALERAGADVLVRARGAPGSEQDLSPGPNAARGDPPLPVRPGGTALTRSGAQAALGEVGELEASFGALQPFDIAPEDVPDLIDELPLLALVASAASGTSRFAGLAELRVKESDRLTELARLARELGAEVALDDDALQITGRGELRAPTSVEHPDHRIAMTRAIANYAVLGTVIAQPTSAGISYPGFATDLTELTTPT